MRKPLEFLAATASKPAFCQNRFFKPFMLFIFFTDSTEDFITLPFIKRIADIRIIWPIQ